MPHDVFISHSAHDKPIADAVCATLEGRGLRCWYAPRDVSPGEPWASALIAAIAASRTFVLILSNGSKASPQVMREVQEAADREVPIIPLRVENVQPSPEMGFYIKRIHWLDALTPPLEKHLHTLADRVAALLAVEEAGRAGVDMPATVPPQPGAGEAAPSERVIGPAEAIGRRPVPAWIIYAVGALLVLGLAGGLGWALGHGGGPQSQTPAAAAATTPQTPPMDTVRPTATMVAQQALPVEPSPSPLPQLAETARAAATAAAHWQPATPFPGATATQASDVLVSFVLPKGQPIDVAWDGEALWVLYYDDFIRLEPVAGEQRFRAAAKAGLRASLITGTGSPGQFWVISGSPADGTLRLARLDQDGNPSAEYTFPAAFDEYAYALAWDGENVWAIGGGNLFKFRPPTGGGELVLLDSYAEAPLHSRVADGLAWDGQSLWLSADEKILRLDRLGQPVCTVSLPPSWQQYHQWAGLTWDGQFLWAGDYQTGKLYRVDAAACG